MLYFLARSGVKRKLSPIKAKKLTVTSNNSAKCITMQTAKMTALLLLVALVTVNGRRTASKIEDVQAEGATRLERQAGGHHHDAVDFGAHTGHKGSFGWHADFPVHSSH